jgi:pyrimidine deaminase RibD-like protein
MEKENARSNRERVVLATARSLAGPTVGSAPHPHLTLFEGPPKRHPTCSHFHPLTSTMPEEWKGPVRMWDGPVPPVQAPDPNDHLQYMRLALDQAHESPPKPSNFRVGALLVDADSGAILSRGYTLELEGNTHAEQCCLLKFAQAHGLDEEHVGEALPSNSAIYTTMEPCNLRLSGNLPCADRIIRTKGRDGEQKIRKVYLGVKEPEKFVGDNEGRAKLEEHGIECILVPGLEEQILSVATAGHEN